MSALGLSECQKDSLTICCWSSWATCKKSLLEVLQLSEEGKRNRFECLTGEDTRPLVPLKDVCSFIQDVQLFLEKLTSFAGFLGLTRNLIDFRIRHLYNGQWNQNLFKRGDQVRLDDLNSNIVNQPSQSGLG